MSVPVSEAAREAIGELAVRCRQCFQCGQCRGACPNGFDLEAGPRRVVRLILAREIEQLLDCEDVWRCSDCGACSEACPMEVDVAGAMASVRELQRAHGGVRCPERRAADVATRRLGRKRRIDNLAFGAAMARRGFLPKDVAGAPALAVRALGSRLRRSRRLEAGGEARRFFAGCALPQDGAALEATRSLARGLGLSLSEPAAGGCCGHPSRGAVGARLESGGPVLSACPACDRSLAESGFESEPLWPALVDRARRAGLRLQARAPRFVPYVGCLADREPALETLREAAALAGAEALVSYPSLHSGCCGALGGIYRGPSEAVRRLVAFAASEQAPIVTPCLLCRDNVRAAVRGRREQIDVEFWPEFFRAVPAPASEEGGADA
ncbi:MAG: heterodisulfide reductase-related iron-sulfur binding cluster [Gaiellaceae bacterium]